MDKIELCRVSECTACKACVNVCPKNAIHMGKDEYRQMYPVIDSEKCVQCGLCMKTCPEINPVALNRPKKVYAAWSNDTEERATSASGGIAAELYKSFAAENSLFTGVQFDKEFLAYQSLYSDLSNLAKLKNSKYVYSDMRDTYKEISIALKDNQKVLFIGTPCQCAGLKRFIPETRQEKLFIVDLICHGMSPSTYLQEHIADIEDKCNDKASVLSFRDPEEYTYTYTFTLKDKDGKQFYSKKVYRNDVYQIGYHQRLIYNEHCYKCKYAQIERCSDLTIGDFSGLGREKAVTYDKHNVSCILVNTDKGNLLIEKLVAENRIYKDARPLQEASKYEQQLQSPSVPHIKRDLFLALYKEQGFERAAKKVLQKEIVKNELKHFLYIEKIKEIIALLLPRPVKQFIKKQISR